MPGKYLLDTSAFRSLSHQELRALSRQGETFYASPYCFWEILSHLDEGFDRYKSELMKFRYVYVLDDPRAEVELPLLIKNRELQERI